MASLDFETTAARADDREKGKKSLAVRLDGREMKVRIPSSTQFALAQRAVERKNVGKFLDHMLHIFKSQEDRDYLIDRLEDEDDPFEIWVDEDWEGPTMLSIWKAVTEEAGARPTRSSGGSGRSAKGTGKASTDGARPKAKRRSTSPSTAS